MEASENSGSALLRRAVSMTHDSKRIVAYAATIDMAALNTVFVTRKAGASALGFGVISRQFREFGRTLTASMSDLSTAISLFVQEVAYILNRTRRYQHLVTVADASRTGIDLTEVLARQDDEIGRAREQLAARHEEIALLTKQAVRLCRMGSYLARSARIEASYAGVMARHLDAVASEIATTVDAILVLLDNWKIRGTLS